MTLPVLQFPSIPPTVLQFPSGGLTGALAQAAVVAGTLVLALMLVAFGVFAYKSLRGGVEWPDDETDPDEVTEGDADDEWKYY